VSEQAKMNNPTSFYLIVKVELSQTLRDHVNKDNFDFPAKLGNMITESLRKLNIKARQINDKSYLKATYTVEVIEP